MARPNILVINPDQMRADALHHLGCEAAYTPYMDALAEDGVSYRYAFCQNPVCVPSRCSFTTGTYPHTNGHRTMGHLLHDGEKNIFQLLKNNGYYVWSSARGDCLAGQDKEWYKKCITTVYGKNGPESMKDEGRGEPGSQRYFSFYRGVVESKHEDGLCHDNDYQWSIGCEEFIRKNKGDKPFFAFLALNAPHPPYRCEQRFLDLIDETKLQKRIGTSKPENNKPSAEYALCQDLGIDGWDEENFVKIRKTYLAMCAKIDNYIGQVIKALKDSGQYDNTAIFIFSDHGDFTGDYSIPEKAQNLYYDCLSNVPLIIKPPKDWKIEKGVNNNLVELIDFYATAIDVAGVESDHTHFGISLKDSIADKSKEVREFVTCEGGRLMSETHCMEQVEESFGIEANEYAPRIHIQQRQTGEHTKSTMLRTKDYKYVMRLYEDDEFYVLKDGEINNEINNPEYADIIQDMKNKMLKWYMETCDIVPFEQDARFTDDFYLASLDTYAPIKLSGVMRALMKLTRSDFGTLSAKLIKLLRIDTNKYSNK